MVLKMNHRDGGAVTIEDQEIAIEDIQFANGNLNKLILHDLLVIILDKMFQIKTFV